MTIAALFVQSGGVYFGRDDVDPWDARRDATRYAGPHRVVAHPPCARWCNLAGLVLARWGYEPGDDGGLFASALASVRRWGGVIEHPAFSRAFDAFAIWPRPAASGWTRTMCGGWTANVWQSEYGHKAAKRTWLYAYGVGEPPPLRWRDEAPRGLALVSWCGNKVGGDVTRPRLSKRIASRTPDDFAAELLRIAAGDAGVVSYRDGGAAQTIQGRATAR